MTPLEYQIILRQILLVRCYAGVASLGLCRNPTPGITSVLVGVVHVTYTEGCHELCTV